MERIQSYFLPGSKVWSLFNAKKNILNGIVAFAAVVVLVGGFFLSSIMPNDALIAISIVFTLTVFTCLLVWISVVSNMQKIVYLEENGALYHVVPIETNAVASGASVGGLLGAAIGAAVDAAMDKQQKFFGVFGMAHDRKAMVFQIARVEEIVEAERSYKIKCTGYLLKKDGTFSKPKTRKLPVSKAYPDSENLMAAIYRLQQ